MRIQGSFETLAGRLLLVLIAAVGLAGCEKDYSKYNDNDPGKVRVLVSNLNDIKNIEKLNEHYAAAAKQTSKEFEKLKGLSFRPSDTDPPVIEGNNATIKVIVKDAKDEQKGTFDWKAVKEGDAWKLTSTPVQ